ncbi:MAG: zinc dependent phospholipase C family protein [Flavobacteriales bacterium]|nr:zinc dependent phospholipase C family protein [Flavobacteriales bacterium]
MSSRSSVKALALGLPIAALLWGAWGFSVHRNINRSAVYALPSPFKEYVLPHVDWLSEHAVDADKRKYAVVDEAPKHYIDLDALPLPWDSVPHRYDRAVELFSRDTVWEYGVLPWQIRWTYNGLVEALKEGDLERTLKSMADLGHYVGDAHVPLHTTVNYNGQLTDQKGIHGLWETRLPELFMDGYDLVVEPAAYVQDVNAFTWEAIYASHNGVSIVLNEERATSELMGPNTYVQEERGRSIQKLRSRPFCERYHARLDGMVEERWRTSISAVSRLWFSAWVDAGQPEIQPDAVD